MSTAEKIQRYKPNGDGWFRHPDGNYVLYAEHAAAMAAKDAEIERLRLRLLSAAGDDLCRLTQEEIKAYTSGAVQIPPEEEFIPSCRRFHAQIASEAGVLEGCLTLAQLIAENERLRSELAAARKEPNG